MPLAGDQFYAPEFLKKIKLSSNLNYLWFESVYFPSGSMHMVLYWPGPGTVSFLANSSGSINDIY